MIGRPVPGQAASYDSERYVEELMSRAMQWALAIDEKSTLRFHYRNHSPKPRFNVNNSDQLRAPLNSLVFAKAGSTSCIGWVS